MAKTSPSPWKKLSGVRPPEAKVCAEKLYMSSSLLICCSFPCPDHSWRDHYSFESQVSEERLRYLKPWFTRSANHPFPPGPSSNSSDIFLRLLCFLADCLWCWSWLGPYEAEQEEMDCERGTTAWMAWQCTSSRNAELDPRTTRWENGTRLFVWCKTWVVVKRLLTDTKSRNSLWNTTRGFYFARL